LAKRIRKASPPAPDDQKLREQEQFFEEVSEELKQERYLQVWQKYGRYFVALAVVIVLAVAGYRYWQSEQRKERALASERFASGLAFAKTGKEKDAATAFAALAEKGPKGYAGLARLQEGAQLLKSGDRAGAVQAFEQLAKDGSAEPLFRDVATIHWAYAALDSADPAKMIDQLKPLTASDSPWRFMALELTALYAERGGHRADALEILSGLEKNKDAPQGIRSRAKELLAVLGKS
jgi:hypothetical protein